MTDHPLSEEHLPNVQSELPLTQLFSIARCPITGDRERRSASPPPLTPLRKLQPVMRSPLSLLFSKLNKPLHNS